MADEEHSAAEEPPHEEGRTRTGIRRRLGRLLNQRELAEDTREVLGGMLEMSDRAKTEAVRLVAREARNYLDELKIKEDLLELITSHSLEVQLSVHLKPLADAVRAADEAAEGAKPGRSNEGRERKAGKAGRKPWGLGRHEPEPAEVPEEVAAADADDPPEATAEIEDAAEPEATVDEDVSDEEPKSTE